MNWHAIWDTVVNFFRGNIWNIVMFIVVFVFGVVAIKLLLNIMKRLFRRTHLEPIAVGFIMAIIKFFLYLVLVIVLLEILGIGITWIVTAFSAVFLAVGLALQNNIANLANGIIIVSSGMFKKGDYIAVGGVEGSIAQINFLYITLITPDNKRITVPNNKILNEVVTNYDSNNTRRVNFEFEVGYNNDVELVKQTVIECMKSNGMVRLEPAPFCRLKSMGDSNLLFVGRCWCDREDYWNVYFDITETVFNEFKRRGISIDYNQVEIRERKDTPAVPVVGDGLPTRAEKQRKNKHHFDLENDDLKEIFTLKHKNSKSTKSTNNNPQK
ncbi:MAG: mechanosensitive ion channel family protein [Eubacteriales bacterium]|nr:mechanosensitive ion channel family protein [Eubacteriales bacterium]